MEARGVEGAISLPGQSREPDRGSGEDRARISPRASAKLQVTGADKDGRRQYLYHPEFQARQEQAKFDNLVRFAEKLPGLRMSMGEHMTHDPYDRDRVCAVAVRLMGARRLPRSRSPSTASQRRTQKRRRRSRT